MLHGHPAPTAAWANPTAAWRSGPRSRWALGPPPSSPPTALPQEGPAIPAGATTKASRASPAP
eukprot:11218337-Lingulodinium_polyedra.AAC.1